MYNTCNLYKNRFKLNKEGVMMDAKELEAYEGFDEFEEEINIIT